MKQATRLRAKPTTQGPLFLDCEVSEATHGSTGTARTL